MICLLFCILFGPHFQAALKGILAQDYDAAAHIKATRKYREEITNGWKAQPQQATDGNPTSKLGFGFTRVNPTFRADRGSIQRTKEVFAVVRNNERGR